MGKSGKAKVHLLKRLAGGKKIRFSDITATSGAVLAELKRDGLLEEKEDGALKITSDGRMFLKRVLCESSDPYAAQHRNIHVKTTGEGREINLNLSESPLSRLYHRRGRNGAKLINEHQFLAGERLRKDFESARLSPKLGINLAPKVDGGLKGQDVSRAMLGSIDARERLEEALDFVGQEMSSLLLDVCCFLKGLECVEKERQWPVRSAKIVLGLALDRLADHYGLSSHAVGRSSSRKSAIQSWRMGDR